MRSIVAFLIGSMLFGVTIAAREQIKDRFSLEWEIRETVVDFTVTAKTSGYVGIGFHLGDMGISEVIIGGTINDDEPTGATTNSGSRDNNGRGN